jgi:2'-5' RNA ligase
MRLFIAIELPKSFKREVTLVQTRLKTLSATGRYVQTNNFHITLHFIGESDDLTGAVDAMREAARGIRPFELHLGRYGSFEKNGSRTSYLSVAGELEELRALYESLQSALYDQGFSRNMKQFTPHITLGRSVVHDELVDAEIKGYAPNASMQVGGIVLFESTRDNNNKTVYAPLHRQSF